MTSLMQCAAMSAPQLRRRPRGRATTGFAPIESVEAASRRCSSSGWSAANCPKPRAPVDSTAARSRSTTAPAVASDTPAASYVRRSSATWRVYGGRATSVLDTSGTDTAGTWFRTCPIWTSSPKELRRPLRPTADEIPPAARCPFQTRPEPGSGRVLNEQLAEELGPSLRPAADEPDHRVADLDVGPVSFDVENLRERLGLARRIVRFQVQLRQPQLVALGEELLDPLARRMELEPVAGIGGDERAPAAVLLHPQVALLGALEGPVELVLVEHEPEVVDTRRRTLPRLDDDVHGAIIELDQPELEAHRVELAPGDPRLVGREVLADPAVARDEVERELADVARLDLADAARDEVIVEELHRRQSCQRPLRGRGATRAPART